jgi:CBS domain-containing membrane protein
MTEDVITIAPGTTIKDAARIMIDKKIGCLPVVENEKLIGLLTETDILRYVVES